MQIIEWTKKLYNSGNHERFMNLVNQNNNKSEITELETIKLNVESS